MRVLKSLILVVCLAVSVMAQDTLANNWAQFRGNHSLTGVSQSNVPSSLKQLWTYEAGGLRTSLRASGVSESELTELASEAAEQWTGTFNPRPFDKQGAIEVYQCVY